jgi:hypothetical protein
MKKSGWLEVVKISEIQELIDTKDGWVIPHRDGFWASAQNSTGDYALFGTKAEAVARLRELRDEERNA